MAKKQETDSSIAEIKKSIENKKVVIGTKSTLDNLRAGKIAKVFVTSNCSQAVRNDLDELKKITDFQLVKISHTNVDLGTLCKKPFSISVLGVLN